VGGGEVSLMTLFGWYLYFGGSSQKYSVGKWGDMPQGCSGGSCIGCIGYFRLYGTGWWMQVLYGLVNRVISAQLLVLECNEVRPKIRHVYHQGSEERLLDMYTLLTRVRHEGLAQEMWKVVNIGWFCLDK
jgi:hypothetical protein